MLTNKQIKDKIQEIYNTTPCRSMETLRALNGAKYALASKMDINPLIPLLIKLERLT